MRRFVAASVVLLAVAAVLAGCASLTGFGNQSVVRGDWATYAPRKLVYALAQGDVPVMVHGDPFVEGEALSSRLVSNIQNKPTWAPEGRYVAAVDPGESAYYLVFVFNPPVTYDGYDACSGVMPAAGAPESDLRLVAAFCSSVKLESEVRARATGMGSSSDAEFGHFLRLVVAELLPHRSGYMGPDILTN